MKNALYVLQAEVKSNSEKIKLVALSYACLKKSVEQSGSQSIENSIK